MRKKTCYEKKMIGEKKKLPEDIVKKINNYQKLTQKNNGLNLIFALNSLIRNDKP